MIKPEIYTITKNNTFIYKVLQPFYIIKKDAFLRAFLFGALASFVFFLGVLYSLRWITL